MESTDEGREEEGKGEREREKDWEWREDTEEGGEKGEIKGQGKEIEG